MSITFQEVGEKIFRNLGSIHQMYSDFLGVSFEEVWESPKDVIKKAVHAARERLEGTVGVPDSTSHVSLFFIDQLTDRLVLEYSTNPNLYTKHVPPSENYFYDMSANYNEVTSQIYYNLFDTWSNSSEKRSDEARKSRGLTGWVAVSGVPLRINSTRSRERLEDMIKENPIADDILKNFGLPYWSHRVSEFPQTEKTEHWSTRFMAVPLKSKLDSDKTIGVLRYSCNLKSKELSNLDMMYFEMVADLLSIIRNIQQVKILCTRDSDLEKEKLKFISTGDYSNFLAFLAYALRSNISSAYVCINIKGKPVLRLIDAHGIAGLTGELRENIEDYAMNDGGLTVKIFKGNDLEPEVHPSVVTADGWKGKNTVHFYGKALQHIQDFNKISDFKQRKNILSRYPVKLIGCSLHNNVNSIGVVKVEFPIDHDTRHYDKKDIIFFKTAAAILKDEISSLERFISCEWFQTATEDHIDEFLRYLSQIRRYRLITDKDDKFEKFSEYVQGYFEDYKDKIDQYLYDGIYNKSIPKSIYSPLTIKQEPSSSWYDHLLIKGVETIASEALKKLLEQVF